MALSPSQRIALIKQVITRLSKESWSIIDLTLKEFSLPSTNDFSGTNADYVLQMVQPASDQQLALLAEHLGVATIPTGIAVVETPFWEKNKLRAFVSHLSSQKVWAADLQKALAKFGVSAFVAHTDIKPTLEWQDQIERALATCDVLVALLHKDFHISKWTDQEIGFAMGKGVPVLAIRLGEDPYGFIGRFQAFNGNDKEPFQVAEELFHALRTNKQTQSTMKEVLLSLFRESNSFASATQRIGYLEEMQTWEPAYADRIRDAAEGNSQISGAWWVPQRVEKLAKKWEAKS